MKNVLISATLSATLGLSAFSSLAQDVDLRMSWWGGNGRHQVTLKALEEFHKQHPRHQRQSRIHRLGRPSFTPDHPDCRRYRA